MGRMVPIFLLKGETIMRFGSRCAAFGILIGLASGISCGPSAGEATAGKTVPPSAAGLLRAGMTEVDLTRMARASFRSLDINGDFVLNSADGILADRISQAARRSRRLADLLQYDVDGDGIVTESEIRDVLNFRVRRELDEVRSGERRADLERQLEVIMAADTNGDRRITPDEIVVAVSKPPIDGDGPLATEEIAALLAYYDKPGGSLSAAEYEDLVLSIGVTVEEVRAEQMREMARHRGKWDVPLRVCKLPRPSDKAMVFVLSGGYSQALSTTTLGSQDIVVGTREVEVENGEGPLWLTLISDEATIWRFTGAVGRIEGVAIASSLGASVVDGENPKKGISVAGVVGLDAAKVTFLPTCLSTFSEVTSMDAEETLAQVRSQTGRKPVVVGTGVVGRFVVPAGLVRLRPPGDSNIVPFPGWFQTHEGIRDSSPVRTESPCGATWERPGGVVSIDPMTVVGSLKPVPYEFLPDPFGSCLSGRPAGQRVQ